jgi:excisionase family DNA binding protein
MMKPDSITSKQAAEILDCSDAHVRLLILRGRLKAMKFGRVHVVDRASVERYLKHERQTHMGRPRKAKKTRRKTR